MTTRSFVAQKTKTSPMNIAQVQYLVHVQEPSESISFNFQKRYLAKHHIIRTLRRLRRA